MMENIAINRVFDSQSKTKEEKSCNLNAEHKLKYTSEKSNLDLLNRESCENKSKSSSIHSFVNLYLSIVVGSFMAATAIIAIIFIFNIVKAFLVTFILHNTYNQNTIVL